jgi:hypothetical protein
MLISTVMIMQGKGKQWALVVVLIIQCIGDMAGGSEGMHRVMELGATVVLVVAWAGAVSAGSMMGRSGGRYRIWEGMRLLGGEGLAVLGGGGMTGRSLQGGLVGENLEGITGRRCMGRREGCSQLFSRKPGTEGMSAQGREEAVGATRMGV